MSEKRGPPLVLNNSGKFPENFKNSSKKLFFLLFLAFFTHSIFSPPFSLYLSSTFFSHHFTFPLLFPPITSFTSFVTITLLHVALHPLPLVLLVRHPTHGILLVTPQGCLLPHGFPHCFHSHGSFLLVFLASPLSPHCKARSHTS